MRNKCEANHVLYRDGVYYYVRRVPYDLTFHYDVKRLCFSLKTKSASAAVRASKSINQRLEDYWLGLRLQNMDIPAIQVVRGSNDLQNSTIHLSEACELYLRLKGVGKDKVFIRTANRNTGYVTKLLGNKPISSYSSNEAAKFRDWCIEKGMRIKAVPIPSIATLVNPCDKAVPWSRWSSLVYPRSILPKGLLASLGSKPWLLRKAVAL
jgi:hypothetical protein